MGSYIRENPGKVFLAVLCSVLTIILVPTLTMESFDTLETEEIGLHYNSHTETVQDNNGVAFPPGRYYLGLGQRFIKFPSTVASMEFQNLYSRTADGLGLHLNLNFDYQLDSFSLMDLYRTFGEAGEENQESGQGGGYELMFRRIAENVLKMEATLHSASAFFTNRTTIGFRIEQRLREDFVPQRVFAKVVAFQLLGISLPSEFEKSVKENKMLQEEIEVQLISRNRQVVEWKTTLLQTQQQRAVTLKLAESEGAKIEVNSVADARALLTEAGFDAQKRIIDANSRAQVLVLDAEAAAARRMIDAKEKANKMLVDARLKGESMMIEAKTWADAKVIQSKAKAHAIEVESKAFVAHYEKAQESQAKSFVKVYQALGNDEAKFLEFQSLKALKGLSWNDWKVAHKDKTPWSVLS